VLTMRSGNTTLASGEKACASGMQDVRAVAT
jgi:hypothetical protein